MRASVGLFFVLVGNAFGQVEPSPVLWNVTTAPVGRTLSMDRSNEGARTVAADPAGNLFVAAYDDRDTGSCFTTLKYRAGDGALLWRRDACLGSQGRAQSIDVDAAGDAYVSGFSGGVPSTGDTNWRVVKLAGSDGATVWEYSLDSSSTPATSQDAANWIALSPDGAVVVTGITNDAADPLLNLVKLDRLTGAVLWRNTISGRDTFRGISGLAFDAAGAGFVSTKARLISFNADGAIRWVQRTGAEDLCAMAVDGSGAIVVVAGNGMVEKYDGVSGVKVWQHQAPATPFPFLRWVVIDGHDQGIFVGGSRDGAYMVRRLTRAGELAWESVSMSAPGFTSAGALDSRGRLLVSGTGPTVGYSAADGSRFWSYRHGDGTEAAVVGMAIVATPVGVYVASSSLDGQRTRTQLKVAKFAASAETASAINAQGIWWSSPAGGESGWGLNLTQQGDVLFATWFTYDTDGSPTWFVMSAGTRTGAATFTGILYRTRGPVFSPLFFDPGQVTVTALGSATFSFTDANNGTFAYTIGSAAASRLITRQVYGAPAPTCSPSQSPSATNFQDLWWADPAGSERGWGLNVAHQGETLFLTWFKYDSQGRPEWVVGSSLVSDGKGAYAGTLYRTRGSPYSSAWNPASLVVTPVGSATFRPLSAAGAEFAYSIDSVSAVKRVTRQVFAAPGTACR